MPSQGSTFSAVSCDRHGFLERRSRRRRTSKTASPPMPRMLPISPALKSVSRQRRRMALERTMPVCASRGRPGEDCARIEANRLGLLTDDAEGSLGAPVSNVHHNEPKTSAPFLRLRAGTLLSMLDRTTRRRRLAPRADVRRGPRHHVRERPVAADLVSPDRSRVASPRSRARFCADRRSLAPRSSRYSGADHWSEKLAYATTFDSWGSQLFSAIAK